MKWWCLFCGYGQVKPDGRSFEKCERCGVCSWTSTQERKTAGGLSVKDEMTVTLIQ